MSETAKTKRLKTMLFVWITTGVNQIFSYKRDKHENERERNK